jgi:ribonuclease D
VSSASAPEGRPHRRFARAPDAHHHAQGEQRPATIDAEGATTDARPATAGPESATPPLRPRDGIPTPLTTPDDLVGLVDGLAAAEGPVALDAERASGFRYGGRAFLVQLRRHGVGTALIDPVTLSDLSAVNDALAPAEWILHAAGQDLPCLAELGMRPRRLFDTELAGRLAGIGKVSLGPLVAEMLGLHLAKGHGADDWSRRPLPADLLEYAALDVEVLIDLRNAMAELLRRQGKWEWAEQEFAAIVDAPPPTPRPDPWRRTSGIHRISDRRTLAAVRELWWERDRLAQSRDLAPHRVLPDAAIVAAATEMPPSPAALKALPVFSGRAQRRQSDRYLAALDRARRLPAGELPPRRLRSTGPPPANRWAKHRPDAAARLTSARAGLADLSRSVTVPVENLARPQLVRDVLWDPPSGRDVPAALAAGGAREWQIDLVAPVLLAALDARE